MSKIYQKNITDVKNAVKRCFGGFTLIELLVVVLIIGILAAVALPLYRISVEKAKLVKMVSVLDGMYTAQTEYYLANGSYTCDLDALSIKIPSTERVNCYAFGHWGFSQFATTYATLEWYWIKGTLQRRCFVKEAYKEASTKICGSLGSQKCNLGSADNRDCYLVGS